MNERVNTPISTAELERRWAAVRAAMAERGIDALLMQNNNDHMGGYVKYFTDLPATNGYPVAVVFPLDDLMTIVRQGPFGGVQEGSDGVRRGVKRVLTTPSYAAAYYTNDYDGELVASALAPFVKGTIGLVGTYQMSHALVDYLKRGAFAGTRFVDASDLVDRIKVIKSEEEKQLCARTASIQDGAMQAAFAALRPGMTDSQVAAVAQQYCHSHGCEQGIYLCGSWPFGKPAPFASWHMGNRVINEGDGFTLLVETNGPGGFYTELGRTAVLGRIPPAMQEEFAFVLEARRMTLDLLTPGTAAADIWNEYNAFMERNARPKEARLYCHGQGYDMVERPLVRHDEPMDIAYGMNIVVHPTYIRSGSVNWICDNFLIGAAGPSERLHRFPERITELS
jgi:Xaa-Pro aminopeptidase